jgi:acid phosphatase type 7
MIISLKHLCTVFALLIAGMSAISQQFIVDPYLQNAGPDRISIMWEYDKTDSTHIEWGASTQLGNTIIGQAQANAANYIHTVTITGLQANTRYFYKVVGAGFATDILNFKTPAEQAAEQSTIVAAISDVQHDWNNPDVFHKVVHDGIIKYFEDHYSAQINEHLSMVLIAGDLVDNGNNYDQWKNTFFDEAVPLFAYVPLYPVLGNHEQNSAHYFNYFNLPSNGNPSYNEHWWTKVQSNIRFIGLNSNPGFDIQDQLDWLQTVLDSTCTDTNIDFVFAELHHPHKSELWLAGESNFTTQVVGIIENFSTTCGKPSIHFFGHTHGYSRGQSRDHSHLMVNVATAGGNIDYWGEYAQQDYDEFNISQDEYGFVLIEVQAGNNPEFVLKRFSLGDEFNSKNNSLEDSIQIRINNLKPDIPTGLFPNMQDSVNPNCLYLKASPFFDSDDDEHGASQWQISNSCGDFSNPVMDSWKQYENWYFETDLQATDDLSDEKAVQLLANNSYCWRVRYRDKSLAWSEWSAPLSFNTLSSSLTDNLLLNPGAELDTLEWIVETGALEALEDGECAGISPHTGQQYFAVGALCVEFEFASAYQLVDVSNYANTINDGSTLVHYGAYLANYNGNDMPSFALEFYDDTNGLIAGTDTTTHQNSTWTLKSIVRSIPVGTKAIKFIIMGTRFAGFDNDSYFDDLYLHLDLDADSCSHFNDTVSGFENGLIRSKHLELYPNPFSESAILNIPYTSYKNLQVRIFNTNGELLRFYDQVDAPVFTFRKDDLSNGLYLLQLWNEHNILDQIKFIVRE